MFIEQLGVELWTGVVYYSGPLCLGSVCLVCTF